MSRTKIVILLEPEWWWIFVLLPETKVFNSELVSLGCFQNPMAIGMYRRRAVYSSIRMHALVNIQRVCSFSEEKGDGIYQSNSGIDFTLLTEVFSWDSALILLVPSSTVFSSASCAAS